MNFGINIPEYDVSQFNKLFKDVVEKNFDYIRIRGEISDLKNASSGHIYLTLKDDKSVLNATIWNQKKIYLQIKPEIGMEVVVTGKISTYAKSISTYSINIDKIELAGEGALLKIIEERKKRLKSKGIFDEEHKKSLPYLPKKIGVITSPTGSVIYDIINRIRDRFPINIDVWPVAVQGVNAADDVINAIKGFHSDVYKNKPDIIIIARGGGSTEDLMAFNDENMAMEVYHATIPVISAIGHETDTTIIDYVSDLRVSTPTAAAEKAVPMLTELVQSVDVISQRLENCIEIIFYNIKIKLENLSKFIKAPSFIIKSYKEKFKLIAENLYRELIYLLEINYKKLEKKSQFIVSKNFDLNIKKKYLKNIAKNLNYYLINKKIYQQKELNKLSRLLESNSINLTLKKGYTIVRKSKKIIKNPNLINQKDKINIQFKSRAIDIIVKKI